MLTMPNGDYIEGQFNGSFTEGVKVNGTFYKNCDPPSDAKKPSVQETINPKLVFETFVFTFYVISLKCCCIQTQFVYRHLGA